METKNQPTAGRIVHYVLAQGDPSPRPGEHRAALVVALRAQAKPNLLVFLDTPNDMQGPNQAHLPTLWRGSVPEDPNGSPGTWHWPERD